METIIEQVETLRRKRHEAAQYAYSEIMLRFDHPQEGDAEKLDAAMVELNIAPHEAESDMLIVRQYFTYMTDKNKPGCIGPHGCQKDAEGIRRGNHRLFMALKTTPAHQTTENSPQETPVRG
ncbi:MAG: hypothetical protein ABSG31_05320 [Tepidisphaeraceae bacterium]|jgi:hypothetical protein